jgi:hypothetical protein
MTAATATGHSSVAGSYTAGFSAGGHPATCHSAFEHSAIRIRPVRYQHLRIKPVSPVGCRSFRNCTSVSACRPLRNFTPLSASQRTAIPLPTTLLSSTQLPTSLLPASLLPASLLPAGPFPATSPAHWAFGKEAVQGSSLCPTHTMGKIKRWPTPETNQHSWSARPLSYIRVLGKKKLSVAIFYTGFVPPMTKIGIIYLMSHLVPAHTHLVSVYPTSSFPIPFLHC